MRRGVTLHWIFYTVGVLWLAVAIFGKSQLAIIAVAFIAVGAVVHRRSYRHGGARAAHDPMEPPDDRLVSRPGLRDRYEGVVDSLIRW